jgi:hypothetical protein
LKVAKVEGVGPVGWKEKRRKNKREEKILGEKLKPYTLYFLDFDRRWWPKNSSEERR